MAAIAATVSILGNSGAGNQHGPALLFTWETLTENDTATGVEVPISLPDRTVQIIGTIGGATVTLEGSLDGTNYFGLSDSSSTAISKAAIGGDAVLELVRYIRPAFTGGIGQDIDVMLLCAGPRR